MEIEKTLTLAATPEEVWAMLLDPVAMMSCVPGMQAVEILGADEYLARMKVSFSFISASFTFLTRIVESEPPCRLTAEGTGQERALASSLKQRTEILLVPEGGGTRLTLKVRLDLVGRLGTFGLGPMKTKADRLWHEFGERLEARLCRHAPALESSVDGTTAAPSERVS
jgi:carbon monoxide dehydrogenase subunit G